MTPGTSPSSSPGISGNTRESGHPGGKRTEERFFLSSRGQQQEPSPRLYAVVRANEHMIRNSGYIPVIGKHILTFIRSDLCTISFIPNSCQRTRGRSFWNRWKMARVNQTAAILDKKSVGHDLTLCSFRSHFCQERKLRWLYLSQSKRGKTVQESIVQDGPKGRWYHLFPLRRISTYHWKRIGFRITASMRIKRFQRFHARLLKDFSHRCPSIPITAPV